MTKRFQHSLENRFHISVGAVLVNEQGQVLTHKLSREHLPERYLGNIGGLDTAHILMRESLENDETLEQAVARGIQEEFGATGELRRYLGSLQYVLEEVEPAPFEKTTLYFEVALTKLGERPPDDEESFSELVWVDAEELRDMMREQGTQATRPDLDESKILEAYVQYR